MDSVEFAKKCSIIKSSLKDNSLAKALFHLEILARLEPSLFAKDYDKLRDIRTSYDCMLEYTSLGVSDDKTQMYFSKYLEGAYAIMQNVMLQQLIDQNSVFKASYKRALQIGSCDIQTQIAQLSEKESEAYAKLTGEQMVPDYSSEEEIFKEVADFRNKLFSYILVSPQWTATQKLEMVKLVTSSLTDEKSAQMMVSAVMLSCLAVFDYQKFLALLDIYKVTDNVKVKEKALIAIGLCSVNDDFYKESITEVLNDECKQDSAFFKEWVDLQKQITICLNTSNIDNFMKSNILRNEEELHKIYESLKRSQDKEQMDGSLTLGAKKDIFMKIYKGVEQTISLEKSGYDTEYKAFAQLKNIPFFRSLVNWFTPFYYGNPNFLVLSGSNKNACSIFDFIKGMTTSTDCGSYALAHAFIQSYATSSSLGMGEHFFDNLKLDDSKRKEPHTPSDYRLLFLRDVYRFFTLSPLNTFASNVFKMNEDRSAPVLFLLQHKLDVELYDKAIKNICRFLYKRKDYGTLDLFLKRMNDRDEEFDMFITTVAIKLNKGVAEAIPHAEKLYKSHSDNQTIIRLLAQLYALNFDFQKLVDLFTHSSIWDPSKPETSIALPKALDKLGKHDEAIQKFFELYYNNPHNVSVINNLWRSLLNSGNVEKAYQIIQKLKALEPVAANGFFYDYKIVEALYLWENDKSKEAFYAAIDSFKKIQKEHLDEVMFAFKLKFEDYAAKFTRLSPFIVRMQSERTCQYVYEHLSDFLLKDSSNNKD